MNRGRTRGSMLRAILRGISPTPEVRSLIVMVLASAVVAFLVISAVISLGPRETTAPGIDVVIESASLSQGPSANYSLTVQVSNHGDQPVALYSLLDNLSSLTTPANFRPSPLPPGGTASSTQIATRVGVFTGSGGDVSVSNSASLNPRVFTLEFGFQYRSLTPDKQMLFSKGVGLNNSFYFYSYRSVNNINDFVIYANGTRYDQQLGNIFTVGQWYAMDIVDSGQSVSAYVDGTLVQSWNNAVDFLGNPSPFVIGQCNCGGYYFNGSLSYLRLYGTPLSSGEVLANFLNATSPLPTGLELNLDFANTRGSIIPDTSGNGNTGVLQGGVTIGPSVSCGFMYSVVVLSSCERGATVTV